MTAPGDTAFRGGDPAAQFQSIADRLPGLIWISGTDTLCTWFNKAWLDFVGRTLEQELGNGWAENVHADDFDRCLETYLRSFDARKVFRMEYRLKHHSGEYRWVLDEGTPLYDEGGQFTGYVGSCLDITEQKQTEEELGVTKEQLNRELSGMRLLHQLGMGLMEIDDFDSLLRAILTAAQEITAADMGNIQLVDESGALRIHASNGFEEPFLEFFKAVMPDCDSVCGSAFSERRTVVVEDVERSAVFGDAERAAMRQAGVRAVQSTPLLSRTGALIGMLSTHYREPRALAERDLRLIGLLARQAADLIESFRAAKALEQSFERERRIARTLQSAFQAPLLPKLEGASFEACYRPAVRDLELGGDFYDVFVLSGGRIALSIGDIFGHGLEAAGAMVRLRETLRAATGLVDDDPAVVLQLADRAFQTSHPGVIASAVFAIYDPATRRLLTANAGHPQPAIVREGRATLVPVQGLLLGISPNATFRIDERTLEPDDRFVLYTDGLIEVERDLLRGEEKLLRGLRDASLGAGALVELLVADKQQDDVAVLVLTVGSIQEASWRFQADDASSADQARPAFVSHLRQRGLPAAAVDAAGHVFGELVANVVRHAPGPIEIELYSDNGGLTLRVGDRGPYWSAETVHLPDDAMSEGGRGLFLTRAYASTPIVAKRAGGGHTVTVRIPLES